MSYHTSPSNRVNPHGVTIASSIVSSPVEPTSQLSPCDATRLSLSAVANPLKPFRVVMVLALACFLHEAFQSMLCCLGFFVCFTAFHFTHAYLLAIDALSFGQIGRSSFWHGSGQVAA